MHITEIVKARVAEIATKEGGQYAFERSVAHLGDGGTCPVTHYYTKFEYKDCDIIVSIKTGQIESASVECTLASHIRPVAFNIESISPFVSLFLRRKSRFKVKCENESFKQFLDEQALPVFNEVMDTKNFAPRIYTVKEGFDNKIKVNFHLAFPGWIDVFEDIISFLKLTVDELLSDNRWRSNKA